MIDVDSSNCPFCKGAQWLYEEYEGDVLIPKRCVCLERKLLRDYLGPEICDVKWVKSELYQPVRNEETGKIEGDLTVSNLFLKGTWAITCQHLRWVLSAKRLYSPGFTFKIITDDRLVRVWLGAEAYRNRSLSIREDVETNNSLSDLLTETALIIIRLGFVKRNKATPQVLDEALGIRESVNRPTWIVEGSEKSYLPGHPSYSDEVAEHIQKRFRVIDLGGDIQGERETIEAINKEIDEVGITMGADIDTPSAHEIEGSYNRPERRQNTPYRSKWRKGGSNLPDLE